MICVQWYKQTFLFDIIQDFGGDYEDYLIGIRDIILKAQKLNINIVGIVSDNLPVQVSAISHESPKSIQNIFPEMKHILHFRCFNHLLARAFNDWMRVTDELTKFENEIKPIILLFQRKEFSKMLSTKIPSHDHTRWYAPFISIYKLYQNRCNIIKLFENPKKALMKKLFELKQNFIYLFTTGFTKIFHYYYLFIN